MIKKINCEINAIKEIIQINRLTSLIVINQFKIIERCTPTNFFYFN